MRLSLPSYIEPTARYFRREKKIKKIWSRALKVSGLEVLFPFTSKRINKYINI